MLYSFTQKQCLYMKYKKNIVYIIYAHMVWMINVLIILGLVKGYF